MKIKPKFLYRFMKQMDVSVTIYFSKMKVRIIDLLIEILIGNIYKIWGIISVLV